VCAVSCGVDKERMNGSMRKQKTLAGLSLSLYNLLHSHVMVTRRRKKGNHINPSGTI
jgi:hypothetical protein